MYNINV